MNLCSLDTVVYVRGNEILSASCNPIEDFFRFRPIPKCRSSCIFINCFIATSSNFPFVAIIPVTYGRIFVTAESTLIANFPFFLMMFF